MSPPHPIACRFLDPALRERLDALKTGLFDYTHPVAQGDDGVIFTFAGIGELVQTLTEFVVLEQQCCPFLYFTLDISPEPGNVRLILGGDTTTRSFIQDTFVSLVF